MNGDNAFCVILRQMWRIHKREETKLGLILLLHNKTAVGRQLRFMRALHFSGRIV